MKTCPICGREFEGGGNRYYCSDACAKRQRQRDNMLRGRASRARQRTMNQLQLADEVLDQVGVVDQEQRCRLRQSIVDRFYLRRYNSNK